MPPKTVLAYRSLTVQLLLAFGLLASVSLAHGQYAPPSAKRTGADKLIFKSVDAKGRIIYSDRAIEGIEPRQVFETKAMTDVTPVAAKPAAADEAKSKGDLVTWAANAQSQIDSTRKAVEEVNAKVAKQNCDNARLSMATLQNGKRVTKMNDKGEPYFINDEERAANIVSSQAAITQYCK